MHPMMRVVAGVLATFGAGFFGSLFVNSSTGSWFDTLAKPLSTPPAWAFAPIWIILYVLMCVALVLVWVRDEQNVQTDTWSRFYFAQLLFNAAWTVFFFGFHAVLTALVDVGCLIFIVICLMISAWEFDRRATVLFVPYLAWITYAGYLNALIWYMN